MARINGKIIANVTIDASAKDLFMELAKEFDFEEVFQDQRGAYSKLDLVTEETGETPYIVRYEDHSYHGSPNYEETCRRVISPKQYQIVRHMMEMESLMD